MNFLLACFCEKIAGDVQSAPRTVVRAIVINELVQVLKECMVWSTCNSAVIRGGTFEETLKIKINQFNLRHLFGPRVITRCDPYMYQTKVSSNRRSFCSFCFSPFSDSQK